MTLGDYKYVEMHSGDESSVHVTSTYVPLRLRQVLEEASIRITPGSGIVA